MAGSGFLHGLGAAVGLVLVASRLTVTEAPPRAPIAPARAPTAPEPVLAPPSGVGFPRAPDGHFYADALVNGAPVRFLIDTGSSGIVLTGADAMRAGLGVGDFTAEGTGVGGTVRLRPVVLARLAIGTSSADNVPAMIAENNVPVSLLGQSFLSRWGEVTIAGDRLTMR